MYILYGIPNCNTVKNAINWLIDHGIEYQFNDYKKKGISAEKLQDWCKQRSWEILLNKKGTTWRSLDKSLQEMIIDESSAIQFLLEKNSAIKRPIIELDGKIIAVGFNEDEYQQVFQRS